MVSQKTTVAKFVCSNDPRLRQTVLVRGVGQVRVIVLFIQSKVVPRDQNGNSTARHFQTNSMLRK
jgi:hypothetical protein